VIFITFSIFVISARKLFSFWMNELLVQRITASEYYNTAPNGHLLWGRINQLELRVCLYGAVLFAHHCHSLRVLILILMFSTALS